MLHVYRRRICLRKNHLGACPSPRTCPSALRESQSTTATQQMCARPEVEYLGYIVSRDGIQASPAKTQAVRDFPVPRNEREVRSFLGLASFYRRLGPNFAQHAKPLTKLLRKDSTFKREQRQQSAFEKPKEALCSDQVLAYPDFKAPFLLTTDASKYAVAAILSQV
jgi:hypothetical protein